MAAPIFDHTGEVAAALSVSGLTSRMTVARVRTLGSVVAQAGQRISRELGADVGGASAASSPVSQPS